MRVDFYHLTASPLERVLPSICEKLLSAGERLLIVGGADIVARLDRDLWSCAADSFLPHGLEKAEAQPILLSTDTEASNGARNIALADGVWQDEALCFDRVFFFFDASTLDAARQSWRALKGREGVDLRYWKQDGQERWAEGP